MTVLKTISIRWYVYSDTLNKIYIYIDYINLFSTNIQLLLKTWVDAEGKRPFGNLDIDGRIILEFNLGK